MDEHIKFMKRCIQLARCGEAGAAPNPMVGAVIVFDGKIIGEGYHRRCGGPHAEVNAIASVRRTELLRESTIYVSLEPCAHYGKTPPCADLIIEKGIPRIVIGCTDPFAKVNGLGIQKLKDAGLEVTVGIMEEECQEINRRFFTFHQLKRPYVTLKWAQSKDGYIDSKRSASEPPAQFSTPLTQTLVHRMRAHHDAIMVGTNTVLMDNPTLTTRLWEGKNPLRVSIDSHSRFLPDRHILDGSTETIVYSGGETIRQMLNDLYSHGVQSLMVEGGAQLLESFIQQKCWDEARVETAPFSLTDGIQAPRLPEERNVKEYTTDDRIISIYRR